MRLGWCGMSGGLIDGCRELYREGEVRFFFSQSDYY